MRKLLIALAVLVAAVIPAYGQTTFEAGAAVNAITAELVPALRAQFGSVLATYLAEHNPNLSLSLSVAKVAIGDVAEANFRVAGGFEVFLGPDNLPNGGKGGLGAGFDLAVPQIKSRIGAEVLFALGTDGLTMKPTIAFTIDVGAVIGLIQDAIGDALKGGR